MNAALIAGMLLAYTAALCLLIRKACSARKSYLAEKILCSLLFVAVAGVSAKLGSRPEAFVHLAPALGCCVTGDVLLAVYNRRRRLPWFVAGGVCFLAGHGLFVWGLCRLQPVGWPVPVAAAAGALGVLALSRLPGMRFGRLLPMAAVYAAFVSAFLGKGFQLAAGLGQPWCFLVLAGAALFWVSDLLILFLYFYRTSHPVVHAANLATYYYGMFLVAISLGF